MFRLIKSLLDPRPVPLSRLSPTIIEDARPRQPSTPAREPDPDASWGEAWARAESASAALSASLARVTAARLAFEAAIAESEEAAKVEEAAYQNMMAAKSRNHMVH
jgi:hypothetical protein